MQTYPVLKTPPIREALLDIKYDLGDFFDEKKFSNIIEKVKKTHPVINKQYQFEGRFGVQEGKLDQTQSNSKHIGMLCKSDNQDSVVQYRVNGYTYNNIKNYTGWDNFINPAIEYWNLLTANIEEVVPQRIGLRYINSLPLKPQDNLDDLIIGCPKVPIDGASLIGLFSKISFKFGDIIGNYILAIENPSNTAINLIVDIDLFLQLNAPVSLKDIMEILNNLRNKKNEVFFSAITENKLKDFL
jgi:uncharacterized protein (TIGR04255 family)